MVCLCRQAESHKLSEGLLLWLLGWLGQALPHHNRPLQQAICPRRAEGLF